MAPDLAADQRLLEDVHALQGESIVQPDVGGDAGQLRAVRELLEGRVEVVHRVPDLVDAQFFRRAWSAVFVERLLLEEAPHTGTGSKELAVADPLLFAGREDRPLATRLEVADDLIGRSLQLVA